MSVNYIPTRYRWIRHSGANNKCAPRSVFVQLHCHPNDLNLLCSAFHNIIIGRRNICLHSMYRTTNNRCMSKMRFLRGRGSEGEPSVLVGCGKIQEPHVFNRCQPLLCFRLDRLGIRKTNLHDPNKDATARHAQQFQRRVRA